jgi:hypothetical protein
MERTHDASTKIESQAPQRSLLVAIFRAANCWWVFCVLVFAIKLLLLWLDPTPQLYMGDSASYIWTALTEWIPADRSYFYGYLVRWLAVWPHSFAPLLIVQALSSGATTIVFALICSRFFEMSNSLSFLFGLLCALDPCQLAWERYVMTETFSLVVYVLVVYWSLAYLRDRRAVATRSRPGAFGTADWVQDELPFGCSGLHDSTATHCVCTLCSSGVTQPIRIARIGT